MKQRLNEIFRNIPLRISITDHCNLKCFFCSNEGMAKGMKNTSSINLDNLKYFLEILKENGLEQISITGGEPTCYPQLRELLRGVSSMNFKKTFFHTNGVGLNAELIKGELKKFSKIAVSIHTLKFNEWKQMTGGTREQFDKIIENLKLLSKEGYSNKVEIKIVFIKGFNDSAQGIKKVLNFCAENGFRFKFLNLEPIEKEHKKLVVPLENIAVILKSIGAEPSIQQDDVFRGQKNYLPIKRYKYKSAEGVLIEIGCGEKKACSFCADSNEIFITPNFEIKPCHMNPHLIGVDKAIAERNDKEVFNLILESRNFLKTMPGQGMEYWGK